MQMRLQCNSVSQCQSRNLYSDPLVQRFALCALERHITLNDTDVYVSSIAPGAAQAAERDLKPLGARIFQNTARSAAQAYELLHLENALADMFILSFCDVLITSEASTFGYVALALRGARGDSAKSWLVPSPSGGDATARCPAAHTKDAHNRCRHSYDQGCTQVDIDDPCFHMSLDYGPSAASRDAQHQMHDLIRKSCNQSLADLPRSLFREVC